MSFVDKIKEMGKSMEPESRSIKANHAQINDYLAATSKTTPTPKAPAPDSKADLVNPQGRYGDRPGEKRIDVSEMTKPLASYKDGTNYVPKTGHYKLHQGEAVVKKADNPFAKVMEMAHDVKPEKQLNEIRVRRAKGGHIITHHYQGSDPEEHVTKGTDEMLGHMKQHMGDEPVSGANAQDQALGLAEPSSFKDGGVVQKSGMAMVHKGETVIPAKKPVTSMTVEGATDISEPPETDEPTVDPTTPAPKRPAYDPREQARQMKVT